jgi:hypothetical protein
VSAPAVDGVLSVNHIDGRSALAQISGWVCRKFWKLLAVAEIPGSDEYAV